MFQIVKKYSILLIIPFGFQILSKPVVVAAFLFNRTYIAQYLCENRTKPEKRCNGKCQLNKELNKDQKREKEPGQSVHEKFELFCTSYSFFNLKLAVSKNGITYFNTILNLSSPFPFPVFHPPNS